MAWVRDLGPMWAKGGLFALLIEAAAFKCGRGRREAAT
jgi:hypothetical protein